MTRYVSFYPRTDYNAKLGSWREIVAAPDLERWHAFRCGKCSEDDFWSQDLAALYRALLGFRSDRLELVQDLRRRGYHICVATNFSTGWYDTLLARLPDKSLFAGRIISSEIGVAKPERGFWQALLQKVPEGSVFIDDQKENCDAADRAGLRAVWAYPGAPVREHIEALLTTSC